MAIWDTGATNTVITARVVSECKLIPTGMTQMLSVNGAQMVETCDVSLRLPQRVQINGLKVSKAKELSGDAEILIGMDIIGMGDFAVSSWKGKTVFTFRMPSVERIDFIPRSDKA